MFQKVYVDQIAKFPVVVTAISVLIYGFLMLLGYISWYEYIWGFVYYVMSAPFWYLLIVRSKRTWLISFYGTIVFAFGATILINVEELPLLFETVVIAFSALALVVTFVYWLNVLLPNLPEDR